MSANAYMYGTGWRAFNSQGKDALGLLLTGREKKRQNGMDKKTGEMQASIHKVHFSCQPHTLKSNEACVAT